MSKPSSYDATYGGRQASHKLKILIVGCGIGGLTAAHCLSQAGHTITVLESASLLQEAGAGIQISPNASRLLRYWGLGDKLARVGVEPESFKFRRYDNGELIGFQSIGDTMSRIYGSPYYHVHRADLQAMLVELVSVSPRVKIRLDATVTSVQPIPMPGVSVTLTSGEVIEGDLIIGADGLRSTLRSTVVGIPDHAKPTGDAAYRAIISTEFMEDDPDLKFLLETPEMNVWMGPRRHLVGYFVKSKRAYNLVMIHPDDNSVESWTAEGSIQKLQSDFEDFEPRVRKLLSYIKTALRWRLMDRMPLESWVHNGGRLALLGDACHPMLPYRAQGAAMAIEDSAVLGSLLSRLTSLDKLPQLLHVYEVLRKGRTSKVQASSRNNQYVFHLPDGPEQQVRDAKMRIRRDIELQRARTGNRCEISTSEIGLNNSAGSLAKKDEYYSELYMYDAVKAAEQPFAEGGEKLDRLSVKY